MIDQSKQDRNRVVVHFKDGTLLKGFTHDFNPVKEQFHLTSESSRDEGQIHDVTVAKLKAVFFVKTLEGDRAKGEKNRFDEVNASAMHGIKIKVVFRDGEILRGVSLGYNKKKAGFFVIPVDPESNNDRVYVLADAAVEVVVGPAAEG